MVVQEPVENDDPNFDPIVLDAINKTMEERVPAASRELYKATWEGFQTWRNSTNPPISGPTTSRHIHGYLAYRWSDGTWTSNSTLWNKLSILRTMAQIEEGSVLKDDIDDQNIQAWLKAMGKRQRPKQADTFSREEVQRFLSEVAIDPLMLPARLLLLIGCNTGCRCQTLYSLEFRHVQVTSEGDLRVTVDFVQKHDQSAKGQTWVIWKNTVDPRHCSTTIFLEYAALAGAAKLQDKWLWNKLYKVRGEVKMKNQRLGQNWISGLPRLVAIHLGLENPEAYTGHALQRTCAMWHADAGASDQEMCVHFGWKNASMAS
jgi:hypothetical protein